MFFVFESRYYILFTISLGIVLLFYIVCIGSIFLWLTGLMEQFKSCLSHPCAPPPLIGIGLMYLPKFGWDESILYGLRMFHLAIVSQCSGSASFQWFRRPCNNVKPVIYFCHGKAQYIVTFMLQDVGYSLGLLQSLLDLGDILKGCGQGITFKKAHFHLNH